MTELRPVFFVGVPRSGTTVLFEAFARHPAFGWPNDLTNRRPGWPQLGLALRLARALGLDAQKVQEGRGRLLDRLVPAPAEAYPFWDGLFPGFGRAWLAGDTPSPAAVAKAQRACAALLAWQGRPRLAAKFTGPGRIGFLAAAFPDAHFVHTVRDGRAVVDSLLRVDFWQRGGGYEQPWWHGGLTDADQAAWQAAEHGPAALAAVQWRRIVAGIRAEAAALPAGRCSEVRYEDFVADPEAETVRLLAACGERPAASVSSYLAGQDLRNMNHRYTEHRSAGEVAEITRLMAAELTAFGYAEDA